MQAGAEPSPDPRLVDRRWLAARVAAAGRGTVTGARAAPLTGRRGFTGGRLYRIALDWDRPDAGAASIVAKLSPADPAMRALMAEANATEVQFYRALASGLPVPQCHHAEFAPATGDTLLLLEDLGGHRRAGLVDGCSAADAGAVVDALAAVHALWWNRLPPSLPGRAPVLSLAACLPHYPARLAALLPDVTPPGWFGALGARLAARPPVARGPQTLLHRDPHVENVLFAADGRARLLDWQFAGRGTGAHDLGYFLISSLPPDRRRTLERWLVARYHAGLVRGGVTGYAPLDCWRDYRASAAGKLWLTVLATVAFDNAGAGKAAYRRADLMRLIAFCEDHGAGDAA